MSGWMSRLLGKNDAQANCNGEKTSLECDVRRLQLDLQERDQTIAKLRSDIERQRGGESTRVSAVTDAKLERLFDSLSTCVAQLTTQAHLVDDGRSVQARDVIAVARTLVRALEAEGLQVDNTVGQIEHFDPNFHQALSSDVAIKPGEDVVIRFPSVGYSNRILRKAGVEKAKD